MIENLQKEEKDFLRCFSLIADQIISFETIEKLFSNQFLFSDLKAIIDELDDQQILKNDGDFYGINSDYKDLIINELKPNIKENCQALAQGILQIPLKDFNQELELILLKIINLYDKNDQTNIKLIKKYADLLNEKDKKEDAAKYYSLVVEKSEKINFLDDDVVESYIFLAENNFWEKEKIIKTFERLLSDYQLKPEYKTEIYYNLAKAYKDTNLRKAYKFAELAEKNTTSNTKIFQITVLKFEIARSQNNLSKAEKQMEKLKVLYFKIPWAQDYPDFLKYLSKLEESWNEYKNKCGTYIRIKKFTRILIALLIASIIFLIIIKWNLNT